MRKYVKVKLVQVNFVPTWRNVDDEGYASNERTAVGQMALDANSLPEELQEVLRQFILEELSKNHQGEK